MCLSVCRDARSCSPGVIRFRRVGSPPSVLLNSSLQAGTNQREEPPPDCSVANGLAHGPPFRCCFPGQIMRTNPKLSQLHQRRTNNCLALCSSRCSSSYHPTSVVGKVDQEFVPLRENVEKSTVSINVRIEEHGFWKSFASAS